MTLMCVWAVRIRKMTCKSNPFLDRCAGCQAQRDILMSSKVQVSLASIRKPPYILHWVYQTKPNGYFLLPFPFSFLIVVAWWPWKPWRNGSCGKSDGGGCRKWARIPTLMEKMQSRCSCDDVTLTLLRTLVFYWCLSLFFSYSSSDVSDYAVTGFCFLLFNVQDVQNACLFLHSALIYTCRF